jgi:hypothetical protein
MRMKKHEPLKEVSDWSTFHSCLSLPPIAHFHNRRAAAEAQKKKTHTHTHTCDTHTAATNANQPAHLNHRRCCVWEREHRVDGVVATTGEGEGGEALGRTKLPH